MYIIEFVYAALQLCCIIRPALHIASVFAMPYVCLPLHCALRIDTEFRRFFLESLGENEQVDDTGYCPCTSQDDSDLVKVHQQVQAEKRSQDREYQVQEEAFH